MSPDNFDKLSKMSCLNCSAENLHTFTQKLGFEIITVAKAIGREEKPVFFACVAVLFYCAIHISLLPFWFNFSKLQPENFVFPTFNELISCSRLGPCVDNWANDLFTKCLLHNRNFLMFSWSFNNAYRPNLDHVFNVQTIRPMTFVQLTSVLVVSFALSIIVGRAKQCLDFSFTLHFWHIIITCFYNWQIPTQLTWWLLQLVSVSICTVLGEWLCMRKETMEIPLTNPSRSATSEA